MKAKGQNRKKKRNRPSGDAVVRGLYTFGVRSYTLAIRLAALFDQKARQWVRGRKKFPVIPSAEHRHKRVWFHCASLGEFEQGRPVMEAMKEAMPGIEIFITFFSPSGYEVRRNYPLAKAVFYLPQDTPSRARRFVDNLSPDLAVFVKYEFWYNYLFVLSEQNIPFYFISARFRKEQVFFKWWGKWFRWHLNKADQIFVQDADSEAILKGHGIHNMVVSGDTRYDRVLKVAMNHRELTGIRDFINGRFCIVAGSTWPPDEKLLEGIAGTAKDMVLIIAPHEVDKVRTGNLVKRFGDGALLYSRIGEAKDGHDILIIDNIGMLSSLYAYADITYVGGGFGSGLHNILEPAAHGKPVIFGPEHQKFPEASALVDAGGGYSVSGQAAFMELFRQLFTDDELRKKAGRSARSFIEANTGATKTILHKIEEVFKDN